MVQTYPTKWSQWFALAEFWYNTTTHSSHGKTPFEVLYGHQPRHFGITVNHQCTVPDLDQWLKDRNDMSAVIKHNLLRAQQRMKHQADKKRQERQFEVGDRVYVKLQPYVQMSVAKRSNQKLSYKFFGSYLITQKVGPVAYKLQLPETSHIHPVIHVSQLKKALPPDTVVSNDDNLNCVFQTTICNPVQVLQRRLQKVGNKMTPFRLVQWQELPQAWATWENLQALKLSFPSFDDNIVG